MTDIFIIGPGFIGWNVLDLLVAEKKYNITCLVRRKEHAEQIQKAGVATVMGELDDKELITKWTIKSDIVFHTATADHLPSAEAVLDGVKARAARGENTIYIHTSGTSVLDDKSHGAFKGDRIYYDNQPAEIDTVPDDAPHREIDLAIVKVQKELGEKAKICILMPPEIYGFNAAHQRLSIQIPTITRFALKHGFVGHVGKGLGLESQIHVMDLARGYIVLLHHIEQTAPTYLLKNPYFFCENGKEFSWLEVAQEIGKGLSAAGKLSDPTPKSFSEDDYADLFAGYTSAVIGLNSRSRAVRLRELGWEPREKGIWESFREDELPAILAEEA